MGRGAFRDGTDFNHPEDIFGFGKAGVLAPPVSEVKNDSDGVLSVPFDGDSPFDKFTDTDGVPNKITEYGYGFWLRFLTTYPKRLWNGKNQAWYFVARLTRNQPYGDAGMGDRTLAIWQG